MEPGGDRISVYPTTIWSEVARAGGDGQEALGALEELLRKYYRPLRNHLVAKFRASEEQAQEWLQEFLMRKVLLGHLLAKAAQERGKLRFFLLKAIDNFVIGELRRDKAKGRWPEGGMVSLENAGDTTNSLESASFESFTLDWARTVVEETLKRMEAECVAKGRPERWAVFKARLLDPLLDSREAPAYNELVARFGFGSPSEASNVLITGKRQFDRILRELVGEYAGEGAHIEDELHELMRSLNR